MTPTETLRSAAEANDEGPVRALLADLPEADRADLIPIAREIVAEKTRKGIYAVGQLAPMLLMVSDIRKLGWRPNHIPMQLEQVLRRRATGRLIPVIEHLLDDLGDGRAWRTVRPLVREGIIPRPDRPSYTLAMLAATRHRAAADLVAEDPGLLEVEAWHLFEVEGGGEDSLANHEKFFGDTWGTLFRELAAGDAAMRQRLLDASLAALSRDFSTYRAGWFSRFHESLHPTDDERAERAGAYLELTRSRVGPTVSFAVAALARLSRAGRLSPDMLFDRVGPVLAEAPAGTAKAGLAMVARAGAGSKSQASRAALVASGALANPSVDVQGAAIALIERLLDAPDDAVARAIAARIPEIAASLRAAAVGLLTRLGGAAPTAIRLSAGPGSAPPKAGSISPLDPSRAIEPIISIELLVDVAVSVLETGEPADDVERVLDAVGGFGADRPDGFTRSTAAIARRARTILARRESTPFNGFDPRADIAAVLLAWATGEVVEPSGHHSSIDPGAGVFVSARAHELAVAVAAGRAFAGVAAPTHRGGWIDPPVLVERLRSRPPASRLDLVAAILRLAPDGRAGALDAAAGIHGEAGSAVRHALGGDEVIGPTAAWWVAAARVRSPGDDDELVERRHPGLGPDAGCAATVTLRVPDPSTFLRRSGLEIQPLLTDDTPVDLPTVLMLHDPSAFTWAGRSDPPMLRWMATIQPGYREAWAAIGSASIARNLDWWSAEWANRAFLEPFIDPVTAIGPHARALIGIALGAKEAGERGLATDVARLALGDGRMTASDLADGLTAAAAASCDRPARWALSLTDVAAVSDDHAAAVAEALARTLPALADRPPARLVPLLRALDELVAATGSSLPDAGRPALASVAVAGGQAGRLARSILSRG